MKIHGFQLYFILFAIVGLGIGVVYQDGEVLKVTAYIIIGLVISFIPGIKGRVERFAKGTEI